MDKTHRFLAGADTVRDHATRKGCNLLIRAQTTGSLAFFFLAMLINPISMRKAQSELDTVLEGQLPSLDDMPALPYTSTLVVLEPEANSNGSFIAALTLEVFRWRPVLPVGTLFRL